MSNSRSLQVEWYITIYGTHKKEYGCGHQTINPYFGLKNLRRCPWQSFEKLRDIENQSYYKSFCEKYYKELEHIDSIRKKNISPDWFKTCDECTAYINSVYESQGTIEEKHFIELNIPY